MSGGVPSGTYRRTGRRAADIYVLGFLEGCTQRLLAIARPTALDIHMLCRTLIIFIMGTFGSLAVNTDIAGGVAGAAAVGVAGPLAGKKALAAGLITTAGVFSAHHDIPLGTQFFLVVSAVFHNTL